VAIPPVTPRVYDSTYAALAEIRGCELWTGDERFYNVAQGALAFVRFIGSY
jgi:predicted nucleic acid-binding protein